MIYLYTRLFFDRTKRDAFNKIKNQGKSKKLNIAEKLLECARLRKLSALRLWIGEIRNQNEGENARKNLYLNISKQIIEASNDRKKSTFKNWRAALTENNRVKEVQKRFLTRLLMSKAGRVA